MNSIKSRKKKAALIACGVIAVMLGVIAVLDFTDRTSLIFDKDTSSTNTVGTAKTTSSLPSAQSDYSDSSGTTNKSGETDTYNTKKGEASITDTGGQTQATNEGRTSSTRQITVYTPADNSLVKAGQSLSGATTLEQVSYRIIDDVSGIIGSGTLRAVNGKFSGSIDFSTSASSGRIDVYGIRPDLTEFSGIEIPVRFK